MNCFDCFMLGFLSALFCIIVAGLFLIWRDGRAEPDAEEWPRYIDTEGGRR